MDTSKVNKPLEKVAVIGLGYVGLPLLCYFADTYSVCGFDIDDERIRQLKKCDDTKNCVIKSLLPRLGNAVLTSDWTVLKEYSILIVAAPTPVDKDNKPDLHALKDICAHIGDILTKGMTIVFESTVAPGTTEEVCVPILEEKSGFKINDDFFVGFSPERINVGDSLHSINSVAKIVAGSNADTLLRLTSLYEKGLGCPVVPASSIKVAEAAKLYENVQRDVLIALANQYSEYCQAEGIDIHEVTKCASTKWNFAEVYPGLVGGHCIGVDPYYLIDRAKSKGLSLPIVEITREINEGMAKKIVLQLESICSKANSTGIIILGAAYKPNTGDTRNSKVIKIINSLTGRGIGVELYDPLCPTEILSKLCPNARVVNSISDCKFEVQAILVDHNIFTETYMPKRQYSISLSEMLKGQVFNSSK